MLTSKQRATLRSKASVIKAIFQVGKEETGFNQLKGIADALTKRELIKISVLRSCEHSASEVAQILQARLGCEIVAVTGNKIVLYKRSEDKDVKHIEF